MAQLSHKQWARLNDLALLIHSAPAKKDLIDLATQSLPEVLETSWAAWNEHDKSIQLNEIQATKDYDATVQSFLPQLNRLMDSHPVVSGLELIGNLELKDGVYSLNDFKSMRELRDIPIWRHVYRHVDATQQLLTQFMVQGDHGIILTVNSDKPFTEEQRTMTELLKQHFSVACRRILAHEDALRRAKPLLAEETLTRRERETLPHILAGKTNPEIGIILGISFRTVEKHVASILEKAGVESRRMLMSSMHACQPY